MSFIKLLSRVNSSFFFQPYSWYLGNAIEVCQSVMLVALLKIFMSLQNIHMYIILTLISSFHNIKPSI